MMAGFLLFMTIVMDILLIGIARGAAELRARIQTEFASKQATIVILLCALAVISSLESIGIQLTELGWISESTGRHFITTIDVILALVGLLVLVPILVILRGLTAEFGKAEALTDTLVGRLPPGVTMASAGLTLREREVVAVVAEGRLSDREIADALVISSSTAATHVRNIMRKTGIKRRSDLVLLSVDVAEDG